MKWPNFEVCIAEKYDIVQEIVKPQRTRKTNYMYTVYSWHFVHVQRTRLEHYAYMLFDEDASLQIFSKIQYKNSHYQISQLKPADTRTYRKK